MPRPFNSDLSTPWKLNMPATLAGKVEYLLLDPIHQKPIYASRNKLVVALLEWWLARESGSTFLPHIPSVIELRDRRGVGA
jgi:hypothetical protein